VEHAIVPLTFTGPTFTRFAVHVEFWHVWLGEHTLPHDPQFAESLVVSTHVAPASPVQSISLPGHAVTHMLLAHVCPAAHLLPHMPQLFGSTFVSKQELPHIVVPPPHVSAHVPCEQT
jgi:hypothetical protein